MKTQCVSPEQRLEVVSCRQAIDLVPKVERVLRHLSTLDEEQLRLSSDLWSYATRAVAHAANAQAEPLPAPALQSLCLANGNLNDLVRTLWKAHEYRHLEVNLVRAMQSDIMKVQRGVERWMDQCTEKVPSPTSTPSD